MADPTDSSAADAMRFLTGYDVKPVVASEPRSPARSVDTTGTPPRQPKTAGPREPGPREPERTALSASQEARGAEIKLQQFTIDPAIIRIIPARQRGTTRSSPFVAPVGR